MRNNIYIGTSGWVYGDWGDGVFYPEDLREKDWLEFYCQHFETVEINATFYHQMSAKTFANWYQKVPKDFIFSVKISRFLTHVKKLNEPKEPWQRFINNAKYLKGKLGPILVQLPPNFKVNTGKLNNLLKIIPRKYKIALEVRDESWYCKSVRQIMKKYNTALVMADSEEWPFARRKETDIFLTADFVYIRMHGPGDLYGSKYTKSQLRKLAEIIIKWKRKMKNIYVYFNNDTNGYAVDNAKELIELTK